MLHAPVIRLDVLPTALGDWASRGSGKRRMADERLRRHVPGPTSFWIYVFFRRPCFGSMFR